MTIEYAFETVTEETTVAPAGAEETIVRNTPKSRAGAMGRLPFFAGMLDMNVAPTAGLRVRLG
jgi:hypothetical protein